jgi:hypothetical protein
MPPQELWVIHRFRGSHMQEATEIRRSEAPALSVGDGSATHATVAARARGVIGGTGPGDSSYHLTPFRTPIDSAEFLKQCAMLRLFVDSG